MQKFPIVLLHGWNLSSQSFSPLAKKLSRLGYQVYCPDLPGFGKSLIPDKSLNLDDYVSFTVNFLDLNKIKKADFICHSFGGRIAIKFSVKFPEKINILVLSGVPGIPPVPKLKIIFFLLLAKIGKLFFEFPFFSRYKNLSQKILYRLAGADDFYHTRQVLRETFQNVVNEKLTAFLEKISVPTYLIWGKEDKIVPVSIALRMNRLISGSKLIIVPFSAHSLPFKNTSQFVKIIRKVL